MKSFRLILSLLILTLTSKAKAQYTYALYGGTIINYHDSTQPFKEQDHFTYIYSKTDQTVRITNFRNYDSSVFVKANTSRYIRIPRLLLAAPLFFAGTINERGMYILAKEPLLIHHLSLIGRVLNSTDPYILGYAGSYQVLEKEQCGSMYTLHYTNALSHYEYCLLYTSDAADE